jgi:phosphodiesterase/alkaline phosphatase D-like protein
VQVSTVADFSSLTLDSTLTTTSVNLIGLLNNTQYYWRVSATNAGGTSAFSTSRSFTTVVSPPSAPTLASPADGATGVSVTPTLSWNASSGATSYTVQVSTVADFSSLTLDSTLTTTSVNLIGLSNNTQYYWRVSATNSGGTSAFSTSRSFTTVVSAPPAPTLASPADGATGVSVTPTLSWNASLGATSYTAQVSTIADFSALTLDSTLTTTSVKLIGLSNKTHYYWRVSATNSGGTSAFSGSQTFTTIVAIPIPPTLISPADSATGTSLTPVVRWQISPDAVHYRLQLSTSSTFVSTALDTSVTDSSITVVQLLPLTRYYWRVSATNSGGTSAFSSVRTFMTEQSTSVRLISTIIPKEYALQQNFPNPFNPSTKIQFSLPVQSFVEIKVYDIMGRELATLLSQEKEAGEYQMEFVPAQLSSGVYLYTMAAVSNSENGKKVMRATKKMILVK